MPITTQVELLLELKVDEIPTNTQRIFEFYDKNSNLKLTDITTYLSNKNSALQDIVTFKAKVTAANIEILQDNISLINIDRFDQLQYLLSIPMLHQIKQLIKKKLEDCLNSLEGIKVLADLNIDEQLPEVTDEILIIGEDDINN